MPVSLARSDATVRRVAPGPAAAVQRRRSSDARPGRDRRRAYDFGLSAEASVGQYLRAGGYQTLARRARVGDAEVDIIAVRDDVVAFVEVKARRDGADGLEAVTARKQRQIVKAANAWIAENPSFAGCAIRFDVALVSRGGGLDYLESAFEAGGVHGWAW